MDAGQTEASAVVAVTRVQAAAHDRGPAGDPIRDPTFQRAHARLVLLAHHVQQSITRASDEGRRAALLGPLHHLPFSRLRGRPASADEWALVESRAQEIWAAMDEPQRRRFLTSQVPGWFAYVISILLLTALAAVFVGYQTAAGAWSLPGGLLGPFIAFVIALGAMGASASIGMNALSLQDDATFDVSSPKFLWLRLLLGALFGAILTFSLGFPVFQRFIAALLAPDTGATIPLVPDDEQFVQTLWLLMPFVLGFSTSLVILVLSRGVEALQTFFGKAPAGTPPR